MPDTIDPRIRERAAAVLAGAASKRAKTVITAFLERGSMSTDDLAALGYEHPPRAVRDVKETGLPVVRTMVKSDRTGRPMAVYRFGSAEHIQNRSSGGRRQFPKKFKQDLLLRYGSEDRFSRARLDHRSLTIDHRIPYEVAGDAEKLDAADYMLLDASSQRSKGWACQTCPNTAPDALAVEVCATCYWAYPEHFLHIATEELRRTDVAWQGEDVAVHDHLAASAAERGISVADLLREMARQTAKRS